MRFYKIRHNMHMVQVFYVNEISSPGLSWLPEMTWFRDDDSWVLSQRYMDSRRQSRLSYVASTGSMSCPAVNPIKKKSVMGKPCRVYCQTWFVHTYVSTAFNQGSMDSIGLPQLRLPFLTLSSCSFHLSHCSHG